MFIASVPLKVNLTVSKFSDEAKFPKMWIEMFWFPSGGNLKFYLRLDVI